MPGVKRRSNFLRKNRGGGIVTAAESRGGEKSEGPTGGGDGEGTSMGASPESNLGGSGRLDGGRLDSGGASSSGGGEWSEAIESQLRPAVGSRNGEGGTEEEGSGKKESVLTRAMARARAASEARNGASDESSLSGAPSRMFADEQAREVEENGGWDVIGEDEIDDVVAEVGGDFEGDFPDVEFATPTELTAAQAVAMLPVGLMDRAREVREFYEQRERQGAVDRGEMPPQFAGTVDVAQLGGQGEPETWGDDLTARKAREDEEFRMWAAKQGWEEEEEEGDEDEGEKEEDVEEKRRRMEAKAVEQLTAEGELQSELLSALDSKSPDTASASMGAEALDASERSEIAERSKSSQTSETAEASDESEEPIRTIPIDEFGDPDWNYKPESDKPPEEETLAMKVDDLPPDLLEHLKKARDRQTEKDVEVVDWGYDQVAGQQTPKWRRELEAEEKAKKEKEKAQLEDYIFRWALSHIWFPFGFLIDRGFLVDRGDIVMRIRSWVEGIALTWNALEAVVCSGRKQGAK